MANSQPFITLLDEPMWDSIEKHQWALQSCSQCGTFRYPPAPICANCLSMSAEWKTLSGRGSIISWVVFHRQYFDDFPPPYNAVAVQLEEGPLVISNLEGETPQRSWIGQQVEVVYGRHSSGRTIPKVKLRSSEETK